MGTVVSFDVRSDGVGDEHVRELIARACDVLHVDEQTFSPWIVDSQISRVRRGELSLWDASADVERVVERSLELRRLSSGWFDPWTADRRFDPTGLVKGWSAMRALERLRADGVVAALVNAGGDVASFGEPEPGRAWRAGVRDPHAPERLLFAVDSPGGVATSGSYERGEHITDARGARPARAAASATVSAPELDLADAMATALIAAGLDGLPLVDAIDGAEACLVLPDGGLRATAGFPFATTPLQEAG
jgi:thiamine biosynthesis lipoprotein